jgi:uncharacterized protein
VEDVLEQRLSIVTLGVANLIRSRRFYEQGLGWTPSVATSESIAFYQLGCIALALFDRTALADDAGMSAAVPHVGFGGIVLAHNVHTREEVNAVLANADAAGGRILKPAQDAVWGGFSGHFADPDNHPWEVAWNPQFTVRQDGSLQLSAMGKLFRTKMRRSAKR